MGIRVGGVICYLNSLFSSIEPVCVVFNLISQLSTEMEGLELAGLPCGRPGSGGIVWYLNSLFSGIEPISAVFNLISHLSNEMEGVYLAGTPCGRPG